MKNKIISVVLLVSTLLSVLLILTGCGKSKYENIIVYIQDGMSENQIEELEKKIKSIDNVQSVQYTSKEDAFKDAKEKFGAEVANSLDKSYTERYHPFPAHFTFEVKKGKNTDTLIKEIESIEGVESVKVKKDVTVKDLINAEMNYIKNNNRRQFMNITIL